MKRSGGENAGRKGTDTRFRVENSESPCRKFGEAESKERQETKELFRRCVCDALEGKEEVISRMIGSVRGSHVSSRIESFDPSPVELPHLPHTQKTFVEVFFVSPYGERRAP